MPDCGKSLLIFNFQIADGAFLFQAAFVVVLDNEPHNYDPNDSTALDRFGRAMLHGKCHDRWFDKSFTLVVGSNGRVSM